MKKITFCFFILYVTAGFAQTPSEHTIALQKSIASGWNTWDSNRQVSFTHMPEGITINLALKEYKNAQGV
jgi:hypothetical protein